MPRRDGKKPHDEHGEVDPEHDFTYGGDMQHDDADAVHEDAIKGGRPQHGRDDEAPDEPEKV